MIKQTIDVNGYWKIIVYYNIDYNLFSYIANVLYNIEIKEKYINRIYNNMSNGKAKAFTVSNKFLRVSVVGFNKHNSKYDYINSIVHEAEHVKQDMLYAYKVEDKGEPPAYTIGFIVMKMLQFKLMTDRNHKNS